MRGFVILVVAVCIAIGVGVALAPRTTGPAPLAVASAILRTLAARSVEITETIPNAEHRAGPAIYEAPDRWEQGPPVIQPGWPRTRTVVIGTEVYVVSIGPSGGVLRFVRQPATRLHYFAGESPAEQETFGPLVFAQQGFDFHRVGRSWRFKLDLVLGNVDLIGGTIELADGYVSRTSLDEIVLGRPLNYSLAYAHFDSAPPVVVPTRTGNAR